MSLRKSMIIVPYWVHETLRRNQMELGDCLNFDVIRTKFAAADLAGFLAVQTEMRRVIGDSSGPNEAVACLDSWVLNDKWIQTAQQDASKTLLHSTVQSMAYDASFSAEAQARLFDAGLKRERDAEAFITYDLAPDVGAIVIYPGWFTSAMPGDLQFRALQAIMEILYAYNADYEVARTPWFRQYLVGLSTKQLAA